MKLNGPKIDYKINQMKNGIGAIYQKHKTKNHIILDFKFKADNDQ